MLKRRIKDGARSTGIGTPTTPIDENQNIINNLTIALNNKEEEPTLSPKEESPKEKVEVTSNRTRERQRNQKKKQVKVNTKFGQVRVRHARRGVSSCLLAVMAFFILCGLITSAYQSYGDAPTAVGGLAILTTIFCTFGFMNAINGFRERDKNYITCKLGILFNGTIIFIFFLLYMRGIG